MLLRLCICSAVASSVTAGVDVTSRVRVDVRPIGWIAGARCMVMLRLLVERQVGIQLGRHRGCPREVKLGQTNRERPRAGGGNLHRKQRAQHDSVSIAWRDHHPSLPFQTPSTARLDRTRPTPVSAASSLHSSLHCDSLAASCCPVTPSRCSSGADTGTARSGATERRREGGHTEKQQSDDLTVGLSNGALPTLHAGNAGMGQSSR